MARICDGERSDTQMSYLSGSEIDRQMMIVTNINEFAAVQLMYFLYTGFRLCEMKDFNAF
jgi:hypothetical protein